MSENEIIKKFFIPYLTRADYGFIHCLDEEKDWQTYQEGGALAYLLELKKQGVVRHIGLSSHTPGLVTKVLDAGIVDQLMFSINPGYDYRHGDYANGSTEERMAMYRRCEADGVGISVMKPFSGGQLLEDKTSPFGRALTRYQCIQYSLDKPGVLTVLPGIRNVEDVKNLLGFLTASSRERDYSVVGTFTPGEAVGNCVYCNHCQPCPAGLNVGLINKYYNLDGFLEQGGASDDLAVAAPFAPMDGMNEKGLCVAVLMIQDSPGFRQDTGKPDLTTTMAVRLLLDKASDVEEALELLSQYDMHASAGMMVHFAIADAAGHSVVVEYIGNEMVVTETPVVTNYYLSPGEKYGIGTEESKIRYAMLDDMLQSGSTFSMDGIRDALNSVSKHNFDSDFASTEWSIVYNQSTKEAHYYHRESYEKYYSFMAGSP